MADITGVITQVTDDSYNDKDFKVVTLGTGQVLKVKQGREGVLMAKWGLLKEGVAMTFKMQDFVKPDGVKIPFVFDIVAVAGELQPAVKAEQPEDPNQDEIDKTKGESTLPPPNPQAVGMFTKEIGDMIRTKYLVPIWGEEAGAELIKWYRGQGLSITRIPFDGNKLPKFGVGKEG